MVDSRQFWERLIFFFFLTYGGSIFIFIESKAFELSIEEGDSVFILRIYKQGRDSIWLVLMGKECAKRLLLHVEGLMSNQSPDPFVRTFREGMRSSFSSCGAFLRIIELINGRNRGSIVVLEGKLGCGWRGFGFHLRKVIALDLVQLQSILTKRGLLVSSRTAKICLTR